MRPNAFFIELSAYRISDDPSGLVGERRSVGSVWIVGQCGDCGECVDCGECGEKGRRGIVGSVGNEGGGERVWRRGGEGGRPVKICTYKLQHSPDGP